MRYHKGLGIGHIYSSLKVDDEMLSPDHAFAGYQEQPLEPPIVIVDDETTVTSDTEGNAGSVTDEDGRAESDDELEDLFDASGPGSDGDWAPVEGGSDGDEDSLELEHYDMYGSDPSDDDYED